MSVLRPSIPDLFRQAKSAGLSTSLDTNDDPQDKWEPDVLDVLQYVDVFLPNEAEARKITRTEDLSSAIDQLAAVAKVVVVKRGSAPAICRSGQQQWSLSPPSVNPVDHVGAGDTFGAGFLHKYLQAAKLEDCLAYANIAGAYSTTKEGGTEAFLDRAALTSFIQQHCYEDHG